MTSSTLPLPLISLIVELMRPATLVTWLVIDVALLRKLVELIGLFLNEKFEVRSLNWLVNIDAVPLNDRLCVCWWCGDWVACAVWAPVPCWTDIADCCSLSNGLFVLAIVCAVDCCGCWLTIIAPYSTSAHSSFSSFWENLRFRKFVAEFVVEEKLCLKFSRLILTALHVHLTTRKTG